MNHKPFDKVLLSEDEVLRASGRIDRKKLKLFHSRTLIDGVQKLQPLLEPLNVCLGILPL